MEKEYLKKLKIVNIKKDDTIVMFLKTSLSVGAIGRIAKQMRGLFPGNKCIVLEENLKLKVFRNVAIQKKRK